MWVFKKAETMAREGYAVYCYDFRGGGEESPQFPESTGPEGFCFRYLKPWMRIRGGFRAAVKSVCVSDPVSAVYIDPAPLMGILVLIYVFIGNAQDIQAESGRSGTSGTGSAAQNKVTVRIVIMICRHGITHSVLKSLTNGDGDSVKLFFNGKVCMPSTISPGWASAAGSLPSAIPKFR